ncbi:MAG: efflux RND transporter periplasmic adaptor subunit [Pyrinomonadaceae bacterium]
MSTQTFNERTLATALPSRIRIGWFKPNWKAILARKKLLLVGGGALAILAVAGFYLWNSQTASAQYMTARVERGNLRNTVTATGTLLAVTTVQVGSQASGTIAALYADFNSTVKKGQVIAQLDNAVAKAQVDQSRANLDQARASLKQARASVVQARAGVSDAQARVLAAKSTAQNSQSGVSSAQANLAVLKAQLDDAQSLLKQQESLMTAGVIAKRDYDVANTATKPLRPATTRRQLN